MKPLLITGLVLILMAGCRKHTVNDRIACGQTMADIAGRYHITKLEQVSYSTGAAQDITSSLTNCFRSGVYTLRADSTISYTEPSGCSANGTGTWQLSNENFYTFFTVGTGGRLTGLTVVVSWDCDQLVLITQFPRVNTNDRFTLSRL